MKNKSKMVDRKNTSITSINNKCQAKIMTRLYTTDKAPPQNPEDTIDKQTIQAAGQLDPESMAEFNGELTDCYSVAVLMHIIRPNQLGPTFLLE
jgi:hypothetical protein